MAVAKFADHLPLYRQSQIMARQGVGIDRSTLADWMGKVSFHIAPIVDRMAEALKRSGKLFADETTIPVLDPRAGKTKKGFIWAMLRDDRPMGRLGSAGRRSGCPSDRWRGIPHSPTPRVVPVSTPRRC
ncbi:Mobile element protein [Rhodobacter sp. AKP1]|nr:Mobile element protein [Rhodobacter sp. AKP1]